MNIEQAKNIHIVEILDRLEIQPWKISTGKQLYLSPVRQEKTPSFYVYLKDNRWHDYGDGRGGDPVDFAQAYLKFTREADTIADALRWIKNMGMGPYIFKPIENIPSESLDPSLVLKNAGNIQHIGLIHYIEKRGISLSLAQRHLKQIYVRNKRTGKSFFALGLCNEEGGYELRNPFFKGTLGQKAISFIRGKDHKPEAINIFEGLMDYLSAITQFKGNQFNGDTIILNSLSCLKQIAPYIHGYGYRVAYSWIDNDAAGENAVLTLDEFFKTQAELTHIRKNRIYAPHKDVNAWHMHQLNLTLGGT